MFILWEHQCNRWGRKVWRETIELVSSLTHIITQIIIVPSTMMIFQQQVLSFFFALSCGFKFSEEKKHEKQQWALSLVLHSYSTSTNSNIDNSNQLQKLPLSELSLSCVFFFFFFSNLLHRSASYTRIRQFQNWKGKKMKAGFISTLFLFFFNGMVFFYGIKQLNTIYCTIIYNNIIQFKL